LELSDRDQSHRRSRRRWVKAKRLPLERKKMPIVGTAPPSTREHQPEPQSQVNRRSDSMKKA